MLFIALNVPDIFLCEGYIHSILIGDGTSHYLNKAATIVQEVLRDQIVRNTGD